MPAKMELCAAGAPARALHACEDCRQCSCSCCCQADRWRHSPFETPFSQARTSGLGLFPPPPPFLGAPTLPAFPAGPPPSFTSGDNSSLSCHLLGMTDSLFALHPLPLPALHTFSTSTLSATSTCTPLSGATSGTSFSSAATDTTLLLDSPTSTPTSEPLRLLRPLGRGSYGSVYACDRHGVLVAAKLFHDKPDAVAACERELHHLALANTRPHPCITALISSPCPGIILQSYVPNGTLDAYLHSSTPSERQLVNQLALARALPPAHPLLSPHRSSAPRPLLQSCHSACSTCGNAVWQLSHACCAAEYAARLCLLHSLASGLHHLHTLPCRLIHRDIKPENVLIGADGEAVLSDFGLAVALDSGDGASTNASSSRPPTTVQYAAPEDLDCESRHALGTAADVYSFGVVLWEAMSGRRPWAGMPAVSAFYHVAMRGARLEVPAEWPVAVRRLLLRCFSDPAGRPSSQELMLELSVEIQRVVQLCTV